MWRCWLFFLDDHQKSAGASTFDHIVLEKNRNVEVPNQKDEVPNQSDSDETGEHSEEETEADLMESTYLKTWQQSSKKILVLDILWQILNIVGNFI
jgi:hypothetical protein